jgi:hypothetical protein
LADHFLIATGFAVLFLARMYPFQQYQNSYPPSQGPPPGQQPPPQQQQYYPPGPNQPYYPPAQAPQPVAPPPAYYPPEQLPHQYAPPAANGRKKALLIGINYFGTRNELKGCINDVRNMQQFVNRHGYNETLILTDDQQNPTFQPTRANISQAMRWLVGGARYGDFLFLHFSGHGGLKRDTNGDEVSGYDSVIYPVDFERAGSITDDEMNLNMVRHLPQGVRLTVIFDCCHSGTGLDLPYTYNSDGTLKRYNPTHDWAKALKDVGAGLMRGGLMNLINTVPQLLNTNSGQASQITEQQKSSVADVIMFSGCKDNQTSADTFVGGFGATGAMSFAFMKTLNENPNQSYLQLMQNIRTILMQKYSQIPQLSSGRPMDMRMPFYI